MDVTYARQSVPHLPASLGLVAAVGSAFALLATYWDDSWHTDRGRDEFAIPPHLLLYGGVLLAALAVAAWGIGAWRAAGWGLRGIGQVLRDPALLLGGIAGATVLASAPVDAAWHASYGRDAVLWSPPHLTAVIGSLTLSVALLAGLRGTSGRGAGLARLLAASGVIGALQVAVLEYDSDVPQFSTVWFLPVAALGLCVALALLDDLLPGRWAAIQAALIYTALRTATALFLAASGFSLTLVPPVAVLFAIDALLRTRTLAVRLVVIGALSPLVWWPVLHAQADVTTVVPAVQLPVAVLLGAAAGLLVALAHGDVRVRPATAVRTALVLLGVVMMLGPTAQRASAHDPGQGVQQSEGLLTVTRSGDAAELTLALPDRCQDLQPLRTVARRAGITRQGPLRAQDAAGGCRISGGVERLSAGRWFIYAELRSREGEALEAWLPTQPSTSVSEVRALYAPPAPSSGLTRNLAGGALLLVVVALLVASLRLARRARQT